MKNKPTEDEIWAMVGFIKISASRYRTLKSLGSEHLMPTEIARASGLTPAQVSVALHDMKRQRMVRCMNEKAKKGRIYQCTELGLKVIEILDETGFSID
jgi:predicted transcriptional regulator